jgi:hypothetical protein
MLFFFNFDAYCKNMFPLLHKVVHHYKIIPAYNTWHSWIVPTVRNQLCAPLKCRTCFYAPKVQSFLHSSDIRLHWLKGFWSESSLSWNQRQNSLFCTSLPNPSIAAGSAYCPLYGRNQTLASHLREIAVFYVYCEFEYCTFISSYHGNETSCKKWDVGLSILGCFGECHTKARFS